MSLNQIFRHAIYCRTIRNTENTKEAKKKKRSFIFFTIQ